MARNFVIASTQYFSFPVIDSLLTTEYTVAQRFNINSLQATQLGLANHRSTTDSNTALFHFTILAGGEGRMIVQKDGTDFALVDTTTLPATGTWHSLIGTRNVDTIELFLNGSSEGTDTSPGTMGTITSDSFLIGAIESPTLGSYMDGDIADVAVWSVELNQSEIDAYDSGVSPTLIRPGKLISYMPLWGTTQEPDLGGRGDKGTFFAAPAVSITNPGVGRYAPHTYKSFNVGALTELLEESLDFSESFVSKLLDEILSLSDTAVGNYTVAEILSETLNLSETVLSAIRAILADTLNLSEAQVTVLTQLAITGSDLSITETTAGNTITLRNLADIIRVTDQAKPGWRFTIAEALNASDSCVLDWIVPLVDHLFTADTLLVAGQYRVNLADIVRFIGTAVGQKVFADTLAENLNFAETLIELHKKVTLVNELLSLSESITSVGTFQSFLTEELAIQEVLARAFPSNISESFNLSETVTGLAVLISTLTDGIEVSDIIAELFTATTAVTDTLQGTDSLGNSVTFFVLSNDQIILRSELVISGEIFACWVLTTKQYNPSVYSNYDFNSYARIDNKLYGAREDGIYLLEGADDAGSVVHTGALFDFSNMDVPETKRLRSIHLGSKTSEATVQVATDRDINKTYRTTNQRTVIGKEVRGKFWTVAIEDVDDLKSMELNLVLVSKSR